MTALAIVIPILVVAAAVVAFAAYRRRDNSTAVGKLSRETRSRDRSEAAAPLVDQDEQPTGREIERAAVVARQQGGAEIVKAETAAPAEWVPPDPEAVGVSRRQFFNRSIIAFMGVGLAGFGAAVVAFLWPPFVTGFGATINAGNVDDLKQQIRDNNGFLYFPPGRMWITEYPASALPKAEVVYSDPELNGMEAGLVALFQKCPHLGCRVPDCLSSQWFECPCHGSQYNQVGEKRGGPAPRGMDRFAMQVNDANEFLVDTGAIIQGPPIGTNTTGQEAEGPNCIGESTHD
jgi:cytochrome b6-f complex iron-sulfur subunit